jgi:hypothetical protein
MAMEFLDGAWEGCKNRCTCIVNYSWVSDTRARTPSLEK